MDTCKRKAYAKINLGLDVLGRFPNGYHEVKMVMQTVDIWDELTFEKIDSGIVLTTDSGELPTDGDNLICKAVKVLQEAYGFAGGVKIHLTKNIPIAAGMAGGSSDAAAALQGVNELYELGATEEDLKKLGVKIGADVPYCVMGKTALAEGIGEILSVLPDAPRCTLLVVKPDKNISTKEVYTDLDAQESCEHPDIDGMVEAIKRNDLMGVVERLGNVLEPVTVKKCPEIARIKEIMIQGGALGSLMSGSGPTVFGIFEDAETAGKVQIVLTNIPELEIKQSFVTRLI